MGGIEQLKGIPFLSLSLKSGREWGWKAILSWKPQSIRPLFCTFIFPSEWMCSSRAWWLLCDPAVAIPTGEDLLLMVVEGRSRKLLPSRNWFIGVWTLERKTWTVPLSVPVDLMDAILMEPCIMPYSQKIEQRKRISILEIKMHTKACWRTVWASQFACTKPFMLQRARHLLHQTTTQRTDIILKTTDLRSWWFHIQMWLSVGDQAYCGVYTQEV